MAVDDELRSPDATRRGRGSGIRGDATIGQATDESERDEPERDDAGPTRRSEPSASSPWRVDSGATFERPTPPTALRAVPNPGDRLDARAALGLAAPTASSFERAVTGSEVVEPRRRSGRSRRSAIVVAAVAGLVSVGLVVGRVALIPDVEQGPADGTIVDAVGEQLVISDETAPRPGAGPLVPTPFAGADRRRLPERLDRLWSAQVDHVSASGRTQLEVLDDGGVVGVFDDEPTDDGVAKSVILALDATDGAERWRTSFESPARSFTVLAAFDDVVLLERLDVDGRAVVGLSSDTGDVLWQRDTNDPGIHMVLAGTRLVTRVSITGGARLTFIHPRSGEEVGRVPGRLFATDFTGTWFVRNAGDVSRLDLRDGWNPPEWFDSLWVDDDEAATIVGGQVVAIDDGYLEVRDEDGTPARSGIVGAGSGGFAGLDTGPHFTQLSPMRDASFVAVGNTAAFGSELLDSGDVAIRWRATGTPIESHPTDRGLALVMAADGGGTQRVIDASTGDEITGVEMLPGAIDALELVGNGVVVKRPATVGFERVGLDLDGNRLWSLVGDAPLAIGRGVVVTSGPSDAGIAVTAYGDAPR